MNVRDAIYASGGRRFSLTLGAACVYTGLLIAGLLTEGGYITLQTMTVGAYLVANGHQKHMEIKHARRNSD